jgi:hypothetical protein
MLASKTKPFASLKGEEMSEVDPEVSQEPEAQQEDAPRRKSFFDSSACAPIFFGAIAVLIVAFLGFLWWRSQQQVAPPPETLGNEGQTETSVSAEDRQWYDEDCRAVVGDSETPCFPVWVESQYNWSDTVQVYSGEWGEGYTLAGVEGLQAGDSIFVAMRDVQKWVYGLDYSVQVPATWDSNDSVHLECAGTLIPSYNPSTMGVLQIPNATVV